MLTTRADSVRSRIGVLAAGGLPAADFCMASSHLLRTAVPYDWACLATVDPVTELITGVSKVDLHNARDETFAHFEYEVADLNTFAEIARRDTPVGVLEIDTGGRPERCARWRDFLVPNFGPAHELRAALRGPGGVWGLLGLYRSGRSGGFSPSEADFVAGIATTLAAGIRAGLVTGRAAAPAEPDGPAVIIVGAQNELLHTTSAAMRWLEELGSATAPLPVPLLSIVSAARAFQAGRAQVSPRVRLRTASGQWLVMHAAPMSGTGAGSSQVVLSIEVARPPEILPLVVAALGLTARERDVVGLLLTGADTTHIARTLHLSPYTVQDHLKSIFEKAGVSSRRELVARVFFDHYAPRIGSSLGPHGWFAESANPEGLTAAPA